MRKLIDLIESTEPKSVAWATKTEDSWIAERDFGSHAITCGFERDPKKGWSFEFASKKTASQAEPGVRGKNMMIVGFVAACLVGFLQTVEPKAVRFAKAKKMTALYTALAGFLAPQIEQIGYRIVQPVPGEFLIEKAGYAAGQTIGINAASSPRRG
ncbi:MAG: hypothetical protein EOO77_20080 [Oxalobacteraceae bacterium]|nr:MAG: hypothetical protein EOO77_20080 [Oxalobacteraceae bacterium]